MTEAIVIRLTGDSGDGMQLVGEQLTITAALSGHDVQTLPDFPAEIRAPAGTVAGVSGFQLAMAEQAIFTAGETLDVLVALNPAALKHSLPYLNEGGVLIVNEDSLQLKDWAKAGLSSECLSDAKERFQVITIPLITNTLRAVDGLDVSLTHAKKTKNFYVLGVVLWLFDLPLTPCQRFISEKFKAHDSLAAANFRALQAGYNYALTLELSRRDYMLGHMARAPGVYRQITGVEAVSLAMATLAVKTQTPVFVAGYPITPASGILQECAELDQFGVSLFQAEDEISAICACLGAAYGGSLALTCTSGPGMDLKSESLGLAVVMELPLVVVDVQRAGASTGLPTKTEQSDLNLAMHGRHGEAPIPVLAAKTPADCFETMIEAFRYAIRYMTPVIILLDATLANAAEPWKIPDPNDIDVPQWAFNRFAKPYQRDERLSRSWTIPGTEGFIHQLGGLEKEGDEGQVSYDATNHQRMVDLRAQKIAGLVQDYPSLVVEGDKNANTLLIGWGSTYGSLKAACLQCCDRGYPVALLQLRHLNPLHSELESILTSYKTILVAELNSGQLCRRLRSQFLIACLSISQCNGRPFTTSFLVNAIISHLTRASDASSTTGLSHD